MGYTEHPDLAEVPAKSCSNGFILHSIYQAHIWKLEPIVGKKKKITNFHRGRSVREVNIK